MRRPWLLVSVIAVQSGAIAGLLLALGEAGAHNGVRSALTGVWVIGSVLLTLWAMNEGVNAIDARWGNRPCKSPMCGAPRAASAPLWPSAEASRRMDALMDDRDARMAAAAPTEPTADVEQQDAAGAREAAVTYRVGHAPDAPEQPAWPGAMPQPPLNIGTLLTTAGHQTPELRALGWFEPARGGRHCGMAAAA